MKHKLFRITALAAALTALAALTACQREEAPAGSERSLDIALELEDARGGASDDATKVDVDGDSGACTWTTGDQIGVMITDPNASSYYPFTVAVSSSTVHIDMTPEMSLSGYALTPYLMRDDTDPAPTGSTPRVHYLAEYSMSGRNLTQQAFSNIPMMAVNDAERLRFYHVGGMMRLIMSNVPENTNKIVVEFTGMTHVCGICTVTNPGTAKATTAITSGEGNTVTLGEGNTVTFTEVTRSASTMYLNVPLPSINYTALTSISVKAYDGSTLKGTVVKTINGRWGQLKHAYGRMVSADFGADILSSVRLSSDAPVTLWKSKHVTRTATAQDGYGLDYDHVTIAWDTTDGTVASVNSTTGEVTAEGPGSATITATATPIQGGATRSASYTVYVNAITGISVTPNAYNVDAGNTITLTATLTNTNHGTINGYPSDLTVNWTSSNPSYVTVASASVMPVAVDATTMTATVSVNGVAEGSSPITASVDATYSNTSSALVDDDNTVTCLLPTAISFPSGGEKYKFRGLYLHPGVLLWNGSSFSVTDGTDPLVLLQHYYYDSQEGEKSKYGGSNGTAWVNCCYFTWTQLKERLGGSTNITGTVSANHPGTSTSYSWRIPTVSNTSLDTNKDFGKLLRGTPSHSIKINSREATTENTSNYVLVNVNLAGSPYAGKGLGYSTNIGDKAGDLNYQAGLLLIPDGAVVTCSGIQSSSYGSWNDITASSTVNVISYDDLRTLVSGGCVFLPAAGSYNGISWYSGGERGDYWSSLESDYTTAYSLNIGANSVDTNVGNKSRYLPVLLVR